MGRFQAGIDGNAWPVLGQVSGRLGQSAHHSLDKCSRGKTRRIYSSVPEAVAYNDKIDPHAAGRAWKVAGLTVGVFSMGEGGGA